MHKLRKISDARYDEHRKGVFRKVHFLNVTRTWPYGDATIHAIYSSHVVEHLSLRGARRCFAESFRCLKTDGILRLAVPDLDKLIRTYQPQHALDWATSFFEAKEPREKNMHHFMYNIESISALLREAGFSNVTRYDYQQGNCPEVERLDNRPESLFVEAVK